MRAFVSRFLRRQAASERAGEQGVIDRDLISIDKSGAKVNTPHSVRALYMALKTQYKRLRAGIDIAAKAVRKASVKPTKRRNPVAQMDDRIITIQKPLDFILQHCPHTRKPGGEIEIHPIYRSARRAADRGRGDLVMVMARQFLPT